MKFTFVLASIFAAATVASPVTLGAYLTLLFHFRCFSLTAVISGERKEVDMPRDGALVSKDTLQADIFTW